MRTLARLCIALWAVGGLLLAGCGQTAPVSFEEPPDEEPGSDGAESGDDRGAGTGDDCDAVRERAYDQARAAGTEDGEARRAADEAWAACMDDEPPAETEAAAAPDCVADFSGGKAEERPQGPRVYFSCPAALGDTPAPVRAFEMRDPPDGSLDHRAEQAILRYLEGPPQQERARGYGAALPPDFAGELREVSVEDGVVRVGFTSELEGINGFGSPTYDRRVLQDLAANLFQFDEVEGFVVTVAGDCDRFWDLTVLDREGADPCAPVERGDELVEVGR